jgi:hypothetical protein
MKPDQNIKLISSRRVHLGQEAPQRFKPKITITPLLTG